MDISLNLYLFLVINLFSKINSPFARKKFQLNCELRIKLHQAEIWLFQKHDIETQMKIIYSVPVLNWKKNTLPTVNIVDLFSWKQRPLSVYDIKIQTWLN